MLCPLGYCKFGRYLEEQGEQESEVDDADDDEVGDAVVVEGATLPHFPGGVSPV